MINSILSNFRVDFSESFFPKILTGKYDKFLYFKNYPLKNMKSYFYETIQEISIPGFSLQTINANGLPNLGQNPSMNDFPNTTINRQYPGTSPYNEILETTKVTITFRNSILNWMYCYEVLYKYYKRTREISDFEIYLTMKDSAEIDMFRFKLSDCFITDMPGLVFSATQAFNESKTFDCTFGFNKFDTEFIFPEMMLNSVNL